jgi:hypothetical protein
MMTRAKNRLNFFTIVALLEKAGKETSFPQAWKLGFERTEILLKAMNFTSPQEVG